jgi:Na+-driven multidrug efflux pump
MLEWGVVAGIALGAVTIALRTVLPHVFTGDAAVVGVASFLLLFVGAMQPVNGVVFVLDGLLIGAGDLRYLAGAMLVSFVAFLPCALAVSVLGLGIGWLWTALFVFMVARMVTLGIRWAGHGWAVVGAER